MKLLTKTSLLIITGSIFIFLIGNIISFHITKQMIDRHVDNELVYQMQSTIKQVSENPSSIKDSMVTNDISIIKADNQLIITPHFSDTIFYSNAQQKYIPHRILKFTFAANQQNFIVVINKSLLSSDKLVERITTSTIGLVIIFIFMIFIFNRFIFKNVWSEFFVNLERVDKYDIKGNEKLNLEDSEILEFSKLNQVHRNMVNRIQNDFVNLKELTANTSHEIQTPLAIIKSKTELLLQSPNLNENDLSLVSTILTTSERLSKLNQSLLLITKIENNQFKDLAWVQVKDVVEKYIQNFDVLFEAGDFKISIIKSALSIHINPVLLDVLISNLLKNAVIHSKEGAEIKIFMDNTSLSILNTGEALKIKKEELFKRFAKGSNKKNSNGLGLEIAKRICDLYGIKINYNYEENFHNFTLDFSKILSNT